MTDASGIYMHIVFPRQKRCIMGGWVVDTGELRAQPSLEAAVDFLVGRAHAAGFLEEGVRADRVGLGVLAPLQRRDGLWRRPPPTPAAWPLELPLEEDTLVLICLDR